MSTQGFRNTKFVVKSGANKKRGKQVDFILWGLYITIAVMLVGMLFPVGMTASATPGTVLRATTIMVNDPGDQGDAYGADNLCDTTNNPTTIPPTPLSGKCTLRAALQQADNILGTDTIQFNLDGDSPIIQLKSPLHASEVNIQGNTGGATRVVIDGSAIENWNMVLSINQNVVLDSLVITNIPKYGEGVFIQGSGNTITNCYIGTTADGNAAASQGDGIVVMNNTNLIGGTAPGSGNLISGNKENGIHIGAQKSGNVIQGNFIGVNASGTTALANGKNGIQVNGSNNMIGGTTGVTPGGACTGACNLISGNTYSGIKIEGSTTSNPAENNTVQGNFIGVTLSGTGALGNKQRGIHLSDNDTHHNIIGGTSPNARNLISGNQGGIALEYDTHHNTILGNFIGTDTTGMVALGNQTSNGIWLNDAHYNTIGAALLTDDQCRNGCNLVSGNSAGISLDTNSTFNTVLGNFVGVNRNASDTIPNQVEGILIRDATDNLIGGTDLGAGNLVGGNLGAGIGVAGTTSLRNRFFGNWIGTNRYGQTDLGNATSGMYVYGNSNQIGGSNAGEGNTIAFNKEDGVKVIVVMPAFSLENAIRRNSIFSNGELGINLTMIGDVGVTPNDDGDPDFGPNQYQNYPMISGITRDGNMATITGTLNSQPSTAYQVEFFSSPACDASGFGEGKEWLGAHTITTGVNGNASFSVTYPGVTAVTATATDPNGNTSEFSNCYGPILVNSGGDAPDQLLGDGRCDTGQTTPQGQPECTLRAAIQQANYTPGSDSIGFNIPGEGMPMIQPVSSLPPVTESVVIAGSSQPESGRVQIDGTRVPSGTSGLVLTTSNVTISGLAITKFPSHGIYIQGGSGHTVQGNWIGVGSDPNLSKNNGIDGVRIENSTNNVIGGVGGVLRNIISGNTGSAVTIIGGSSTGNKVTGNYLGLTPSGLGEKGNGGHGVLVQDGSQNIIGGSLAGEGNWIAYNHLNGVTILGSSATQNRILLNGIFANNGLGIDLGNDGPTANDLLDEDGGENNRQNFPVFKDLRRNKDYISGVLSSTPVQTFHIEFFASTGCDPSKHGEGHEFVGEINVTTSALGVAEFTFNTTAHHDRLLTATVTDPFGSTSEFSECHAVIIEDVKIEHQKVSTGQWEEMIDTIGTVDGNTVRLTAFIRNRGAQPEQAEVHFINPETGQELGWATRLFSPGVTQVEYLWDTSGYAWEDDRSPRVIPRPISVQVKQFLPGFGERQYDALTLSIKVRPKPIILVHGWWTNALSSWGKFEEIMQNRHPWWKGYAVGDGRAPGVMDTGGPWSLGKTINQNAMIMRDYIQSVRELENAWHVDIVAHSKGGLISRFYIQAYMPLKLPDGKPMASHLLMMGTPNLGSPCAIRWHGFFELTYYHVQERFNPFVTRQRGVPFAIEAGRPLGAAFDQTCLKFSPGDGVVEVTSAWGLPYVIDVAEVRTQHTAMTEVQADFDYYVLPRLARTPADQPVGDNSDEALFAEMQADQPDPQLLYANPQIEIAAGQTITVELNVPQATRLGFLLVAGPEVRSTLYAPDNQAVWNVDANSEQAGMMFRSYQQNNPNTGTWRLEMQNTSDNPTQIVAETRVEGAGLQITLSAGDPDGQNRLPIVATLTHAGAPALGAALQADLDGINGGHYELNLVDDGQHGDGAASDGVYGGLSPALAPDEYNLFAHATWNGQDRMTFRYVTATLTDLALEKTVVSDQAKVGHPLTYTLTVTNQGLSEDIGVTVIDTIPTSVSFVSVASSTGGGCDQSDGTITCKLALRPAQQETITIVIIPLVTGALTNTATVQGSVRDPSPDNNTAEVSVFTRARSYIPKANR